MMILLNTATIVCIGLMIGVEFAVSAFINPVIWKLDSEGQAQAVRLFAGKLGRAMPIWYGLALLLMLTEAVRFRHDPSAVLLNLASATWVLVILATLLFLVPINNRLARMDSREFSEEERKEHRRWDSMHRVRVGVLIAAQVCLLIAVQL